MPTRRSGDRASKGKTSRRTQLPPRLVNSDGKFNVIRVGLPHIHWRDLYHFLLILPWGTFLGGMAISYILANACFALLYLASGDNIANAHPGSFLDAFFFSVQTMASIGYGAMYPQTVYAGIVVTVESMVSLMGLAVGTGLIFARFSRPTARVLFSRVAVIVPQHNTPVLMFRAANQRSNQILEAQIRLTLVRNEVNDQGQEMRRFYDMKLMRSQSPIFALTWTAMHPIDQESPLYGLSSQDLDDIEAEVVITLIGIDATFSQTIYARHSYIPSEIFWDMQFVDILSKTNDGRRLVNYTFFHNIEPLSNRNRS